MPATSSPVKGAAAVQAPIALRCVRSSRPARTRPGLSKLILKGWILNDFYNSFFDRLLACYPAAVLKWIEGLFINIPNEAYSFRDKEALPSPPRSRRSGRCLSRRPPVRGRPTSRSRSCR